MDPVYGKVLTNYFLPQINPVGLHQGSELSKPRTSRNITFQTSRNISLQSNDTVDSHVHPSTHDTTAHLVDQFATLNATAPDPNLSESEKSWDEDGELGDFEIEVVSLRTNGGRLEGVRFEQLSEDESGWFGLLDSTITVVEVVRGAQWEVDGRLRVGDRVLEVNDTSVRQLGLQQVLDLVALRGGTADLLVRHDPPSSQFTSIVISRESMDDRFGITIKPTTLGENGRVELLVVHHLERINRDVIAELREGDYIVEVDGVVMLDKSTMDFVLLIERLLSVRLVVYRPAGLGVPEH